MKRRIVILFLIVIFTLLLTISAFALSKEERAWKEDILTLLPMVKRVGDYSELVDLIEVAPALKKDPEIIKAYITFAPPGVTPPEWAREEITPPTITEVPEKIPVEVKEKPLPPAIEAEVEREEIFRLIPMRKKVRPLTKEEKKEVRKHYLIGKRYYNAKKDKKAIEEFKKALALDPNHKKAIKYLSESHYHLGRRYYRDKDYGKAMAEFERVLAKNPEHKKAKKDFAKLQARIEEKGEKARAKEKEKIEAPKRVEVVEKIAVVKIEEKEEARRIAREVAAQKEIQKREVAFPEIIKEEPKIEAPKEAEIVTEGPPTKIGMMEEVPAKEELPLKSEEKSGVKPTPLPKEAKVIHSTDVVSGVKAEMVEGKAKIIITLSGERKYTVSERSRPPAIVIDIPHTINTVFPGRIMVNQGGVRMIEVTQHRVVPFDETRVIIRLSRFKEYEVKSKENKIYVEFEE